MYHNDSQPYVMYALKSRNLVSKGTMESIQPLQRIV